VAAKVESPNEISLNGVFYPIARPVQSVLASLYPSKVVIGDTTKDSQARTSVIAWSDWRGGIGVNRMEHGGDVNRAWWSTLQLRYKNHLILPGLDNDAAANGTATSLTGPTIGAIAEYANAVYVAWNGSISQDAKVYLYNNTSDAWGSALATPSDQVTDTVTWRTLASETFLIFAHYDTNGSGYTRFDGSTWTEDAFDTQYVAVWDDRLWGISYAGQLWYSIVAGTEVTDAKLPLPPGSVTALFVARDAGGEPIIYAATKKGLFAHDAANSQFVQTELTLPNHPFAGRGTIRWRDSIYMPAGLGLYRYINQAGGAVLTIAGPDRDDGLPADNRGTIKYMSGSHNELFAGVDSSTAAKIVSSSSLPYQWQSHQGSTVIDADTGYSSILGYNELGWETKWAATTVGKSIQHMLVSDAYSEYRLWWGFDGEIKFMKIPSDIINPSFVSDFEFRVSGTHETPWFNAGQSEVDKLALKLRTEVQDASSTETVTVSYATDYSESYTSAGSAITSDGITTYTFGSKAGTTFRAIKFKVALARTTNTSTANYKKLTPDMVSLTLEWRKKLPAKWGHQIQIDLSKDDYKGKSPKDLRAALLSAIESTTLVEFTFRDDSGGDRNFYVDVTSATGLEFSGYDERGQSTVSLVEP